MYYCVHCTFLHPNVISPHYYCVLGGDDAVAADEQFDRSREESRIRPCQCQSLRQSHTLNIVYKGFWILKTRGIPYYFQNVHSFLSPIFPSKIEISLIFYDFPSLFLVFAKFG